MEYVVDQPTINQSDGRHICRMCNATPEAYNSNNMNNCELLVMEDIKQLYYNIDAEALFNLMQYNTWQAFFDINYGGLPGRYLLQLVHQKLYILWKMVQLIIV